MDVTKLVPFTGYYALNVAPGAFLSIDTIEERSMSSGQSASAGQVATNISINVSMDGGSVTTHPFGDGATFDGVTLNVPGQLTLEFSREYSDGHLASFTGTIDGVDVRGETYFNQVPLSAFIGDYYDTQTSRLVLSIKANSELLFDFAMFSGVPGELQRVQRYGYMPAMFVLTFASATGSEPRAFTLMLGTAGKNGLACSIQGGATPRLAVSILPYRPGP
ncbi:MAG TPA: hypothetical protein VHT05_07445 [Candidatus Elarobacter sp.]|jgi:hypothetical protein|nr:hypothetical protein [Candidatus Elarobacter sp.]